MGAYPARVSITGSYGGEQPWVRLLAVSVVTPAGDGPRRL